MQIVNLAPLLLNPGYATELQHATANVLRYAPQVYRMDLGLGRHIQDFGTEHACINGTRFSFCGCGLWFVEFHNKLSPTSA